MSKKRQLDGKATKLAKLPLTRVLSKKVGEAAAQPWEPALPPEAPTPAADPQLPLSWEELAEGAAGLLKAAYVLIRGEVAALHALIHGHPEPEIWEPGAPDSLPAIKEALRQTRAELQEVSRLFNP